MYWRGDDEKPYRTFAALSADLEELVGEASPRSRGVLSGYVVARYG
jgi:hypothetical protein